MVAERERRRIRLEDAETNILHGVWSRSGKLRLHVASPKLSEGRSDAVVELTPDQAQRLERFLQNEP
jgi:hypothetical protein